MIVESIRSPLCQSGYQQEIDGPLDLDDLWRVEIKEILRKTTRELQKFGAGDCSVCTLPIAVVDREEEERWSGHKDSESSSYGGYALLRKKNK